MRLRLFVPLIGIFLLAGCRHHLSFSGEADEMSAPRAAAVTADVRGFMQTVAQDITRDGPTAWRREFADTPAFFMAAEGRLAFADSAAATAGIAQLPKFIKEIELRWGDDLRVDPLTQDLAVVGSSYHESRVDPAGKRTEESGYFTAVAQFREGHWQFRDAHWSVVPATPAVP
jgi:hypothetical protein